MEKRAIKYEADEVLFEIDLNCMYYGKPEARDEVLVYLKVALPFKLEDTKAREGLMLNASKPKIESKDNKKE